MDHKKIDQIWKPLLERKIVEWYAVGFSDGQTSMFGAVFILRILQRCLLVLDSIRCLVLRINKHSLVPLPKRSQLPETIKHMC